MLVMSDAAGHDVQGAVRSSFDEVGKVPTAIMRRAGGDRDYYSSAFLR